MLQVGVTRDFLSPGGSILEIAAGRVPAHVVNRDVLNSPLFQAKLRR